MTIICFSFPINVSAQRIEKLIVGRLFGAKWAPHIKNISVQIAFIMLGLKRGYLWDSGPVTQLSPFDVYDIVNIVNGAFKTKMTTLTMGDDVIIYNKASRPIKYEDHVFVDISKHLDAPKIVDNHIQQKMEELIDDLNEQISKFFSNAIPMEVMTDTDCIPTIFGLLIGYPVIYWYDDASVDDNCLAHVDLFVNQLICNNKNIMSFSVPVQLVDESQNIRKLLEKFTEVYKSLECSKLEDFIKNLDVVVL